MEHLGNRVMNKKTSQKQVLANRQNAKKSTGPKTVEGKRTVRWNSLKHGLLAKATILTIVDFEEDPREFEFLLEELQADLQPIGVLEQILVEKIAAAYWRLRRVLKSEQGEIEQGVLDRRHDNISDHELRQQFATVHGLDLLFSRLSRTVIGIENLQEVLEQVRKEVVKNGFVTESMQKLLNCFFGKECVRVAMPCKILSQIAEKNMELSKLDPAKELVNKPSAEKCKERILSILDKESRRLDATIDEVSVVEEHHQKSTVARLSLPSQEASLKILRYETTIQRQFARAMDQLERLQRRRLGDMVPPPIKVNIS